MHITISLKILFPHRSLQSAELSSLCCTAAAAAKSLQSCPTLCDPIDGSPPGSPVPGILQARTLEWGAIAFSAYAVQQALIIYSIYGRVCMSIPISQPIPPPSLLVTASLFFTSVSQFLFCKWVHVYHFFKFHI